MLKILTFLTLFLALVSGKQRDEDSSNKPLLNFITGPQKPSQNLQGDYFKEPSVQKKPCPNRRSQSGNTRTAEEWVPTFHWKYVRPEAKTNYNSNVGTERDTLQLQSLKNEEVGNINVGTERDTLQSQSLKNKEAGNTNVGTERNTLQSQSFRNEEAGNTNVGTERVTAQSQYSKNEEAGNRNFGIDRDTLQSQSLNFANRADSDDTIDGLDNDDSFLSSEITNSRRSLPEDASLDDVLSTVRHNKDIMESTIKVENPLKPLLPENDNTVNIHNKEFPTEDFTFEQVEDYEDESRNDNPKPKARQIQNEYKDSVKEQVAQIEGHLLEPTKGEDLSKFSGSRILLIQNSRVCYACSSANDNSCWSPTRRTTVKYCRNGHDVCVTRTYKSQRTGLILIRDCAESCEVRNIGLEIKYKSCSLCQNDLCNSIDVDINGSYSINSYNMLLVLFVTCFVKCTF